MHKTAKLLIQKYFEKHSFVRSDIESFNGFVEKELQKVIEDNKTVEPTIIPPNIDSYKIRLDKIWVTKPEITEADGSKRPIFPVEARLRKISYSAPIFMEISAHINDVQRESFVMQIGNLPIMLKSNFCHLNKLSRDELIEKAAETVSTEISPISDIRASAGYRLEMIKGLTKRGLNELIYGGGRSET